MAATSPSRRCTGSSSLGLRPWPTGSSANAPPRRTSLPRLWPARTPGGTRSRRCPTGTRGCCAWRPTWRSTPAAHQDALDVAEAATMRMALVAALQSLPNRQRQAVALRYLSGLREEEVATALGVSTSTASTHLRRGLDALRARLGDTFTEHGIA